MAGQGWSYDYQCMWYEPFEGESADSVIASCFDVRAVVEDGEEVGDVLFCVVLRRDVGEELWSESALRRSLPLKSSEVHG